MAAELVLLVEHLLDTPIKAYEIQQWTKRDPLLARVNCFIQWGRPDAGGTPIETILDASLQVNGRRQMHRVGFQGHYSSCGFEASATAA